MIHLLIGQFHYIILFLNKMIESFYCAAMRHTAYGGKKSIDYVF